MRVFVEVTQTALYGGHTGIQRVVRNIVRNRKAGEAATGIECRPVTWRGDGFVHFDATDLDRQPSSPFLLVLVDALWDFLRLCYGFARRRKTLIVRCAQFIFGVVVVPMYRIVSLVRAVCGRYSSPIAAGGLTFHAWAKVKWEVMRPKVKRVVHLLKQVGRRPKLLFAPRVGFREGDILFLADSSWTLPFWTDLARAKRNGAKIGYLLYDRIPITHPQFCDPANVKAFRSWYSEVNQVSEFCLAISQTVEREISRQWRGYRKKARPGQLRTASFRLGANLDGGKQQGTIREAFKEVFRPPGQPTPYIMVSTIEPRKSHGFVMDAFERVWKEGVPARLCLIGKAGWLCEATLARIRHHKELGSRLLWFEDASDAELQWAYGHTRASIFASMCEGFGLPIVEALLHRRPVFASNIPVHREVGGEFCVYFDLSSPGNLAQLILDFERSGEVPGIKSLEDFQWPDWEQSTIELFQQIKSFAFPEPSLTHGPTRADERETSQEDESDQELLTLRRFFAGSAPLLIDAEELKDRMRHQKAQMQTR